MYTDKGPRSRSYKTVGVTPPPPPAGLMYGALRGSCAATDLQTQEVFVVSHVGICVT